MKLYSETPRKKVDDVRRIFRYAVICALLWTGLLVVLFISYFVDNRHAILEIGHGMALVSFEKDVLFRRWADLHGGVYVPVTAGTPSNPYLENISERDITTPSGRRLTLINPAYMSRQIYEMAREQPGIPQGHITSLNPIRPENAPDSWEARALNDLKQGVQEVVEPVPMNGLPHLRFMRQLVTEKPCLKCHASQGYKEGDGRGGISITVSLVPITKTMNSQAQQVAFIHVLIWLLGMGVIMVGNRKIANTLILLRNERNNLYESEESYRRQFADNSSIMLLIDSADGHVIDANSAAVDFYGYSLGQLLKMYVHEINVLPSSDIMRHMDSVTSGQGRRFEFQHCLADGSIREVEESSSRILLGKRQILHAIIFDITERKRVEKELGENRKQLADIIEFLPDATLGIDAAKRVIIWNRAIEEMTGIVAADMIGKGDHAYTIPFYGEARPLMMDLLFDDCEEVAARYPTIIRAGETLMAEVFCKALNNNKGAWVFAKASPLRDRSGTIIGAIESIRDITVYKRAEEERWQLEQQFQHTQKLESLGVLAGGIAHDFNNILAIITGYCSLIKMDYGEAETYIPIIEKATDRAAELCRQMLTYAGKAQLTQTQVDMRMLVEEMVTMLKSTINQNAVIRLECPADIPVVNGDASQLRQIVMNLIINASEAIGEAQGEIRVSLSTSAVKAGESVKDHLDSVIAPGWYVSLNVTDTGCGMDDETKLRIFEPFYTTKFTGRGLGMSAVLGIVTAHKGALQLSSQPGKGTSFTVLLPVQSRDPNGDYTHQLVTSPASWHGSGTVLLVEDEEQVSMIARIMLEKLGYTVICAVNGSEALELFQRHTGEISLVVTDLGMPVMDGYLLFRELKKRDSDLPIIIASGFGEKVVTSRIARDEIAGLINKPYNFDQLREALKRVAEDKA